MTGRASVLTRAALAVGLLLTASLASVAAIAAPPEVMEERGGARLRVLDKITARTSMLELKVGAAAAFGGVVITLRACRENPPTETPEAAAFLEIDEQGADRANRARVFSGWMFASSPALSAMEHAVYDVWVLGCTGG